MFDLEGKIVIITGASSGIGAALAQGFSRAGARVVLAARRKQKLEMVAAECPGDHLSVEADVTDPQGRRDILQKTLERWGRLDILVNNAGIGAYGHFLDTTEAEWRRLFEINLFAPVLLTGEALKIMLNQGAGLIINLASLGGLLAHADKVAAYVASKHALLGFSRGLARDLAGTGIRVLAVCPHLTATEFFSASGGAEELAPEVKKYQGFMDSPEEVARGILDQLDASRLVVFPTDKPARAYAKQKDL
ncbi:MAG: SDR family oxidoreductase [Deltaproteobacteria bacterium]|nr:SDR family oxidoreductase [Deltaproteobacteria bacterium]